MTYISASSYRWLSLFLYLISMVFPAYYIGETREPQVAGILLLMGWIGPIDGHFSWFANIAYVLAQIKHKQPRLSASFGLMATALALSFLLHKTIIISEVPTYARITAYGWGYFLWIASIGLFAIGSLSRSIFSGNEITGNTIVLICQSSFLAVALYIFIQHHYFDESSQAIFEQNRELLFEDKCKLAGEIIYKQPKLVRGLFFDPDWGIQIQQIKSTNRWHLSGVGVVSHGLLNSGFIKFYEVKKSAPDKAHDGNTYVQHEKTSSSGIPIEKLDSEYAIVKRDMNIPEKFNIFGGELLIIDLEDKSVLAKTTYVFSKAEERFCGHSIDGYFNTDRFVMRALKLEKRYPSAFDHKP